MRTYALRLSFIYVVVFSLATSALIGLLFAYAVRTLDGKPTTSSKPSCRGSPSSTRRAGSTHWPP